jgi:hypothetical protein
MHYGSVKCYVGVLVFLSWCELHLRAAQSTKKLYTIKMYTRPIPHAYKKNTHGSPKVAGSIPDEVIGFIN